MSAFRRWWMFRTHSYSCFAVSEESEKNLKPKLVHVFTGNVTLHLSWRKLSWVQAQKTSASRKETKTLPDMLSVQLLADLTELRGFQRSHIQLKYCNDMNHVANGSSWHVACTTVSSFFISSWSRPKPEKMWISELTPAAWSAPGKNESHFSEGTCLLKWNWCLLPCIAPKRLLSDPNVLLFSRVRWSWWWSLVLPFMRKHFSRIVLEWVRV